MDLLNLSWTYLLDLLDLSVLSLSVNVVPLSKKLNEFSVKQDVEKLLCHFQLKAFSNDKEDDSNT